MRTLPPFEGPGIARPRVGVGRAVRQRFMVRPTSNGYSGRDGAVSPARWGGRAMPGGAGRALVPGRGSDREGLNTDL